MKSFISLKTYDQYQIELLMLNRKLKSFRVLGRKFKTWSLGNVLYTQLCLYEQQKTRIYKNISLILFSKGAPSLL